MCVQDKEEKKMGLHNSLVDRLSDRRMRKKKKRKERTIGGGGKFVLN